MEVSVKVFFPEGFPMVSKMLIFQSECLVGEIYKKLYEYGLDKEKEEEYGLYMEVLDETKQKKKNKKKGIWLDRNRILSSYADIFSVDFIELKRKELKKKKSIKEFIYTPSPPLPSSPRLTGELLYEGKVLKFQQSTKQWKPRHLKLFKDGFEYSKSQESGNITTISLKNIKNVEVVKSTVIHLNVLLENQRILKFEWSENEEALGSWLQVYHSSRTNHKEISQLDKEEEEDEEDDYPENIEAGPPPIAEVPKPLPIPPPTPKKEEGSGIVVAQNGKSTQGENIPQQETRGNADLPSPTLKDSAAISTETSPLVGHTKNHTKKRDGCFSCCC